MTKFLFVIRWIISAASPNTFADNNAEIIVCLLSNLIISDNNKYLNEKFHMIGYFSFPEHVVEIITNMNIEKVVAYYVHLK